MPLFGWVEARTTISALLRVAVPRILAPFSSLPLFLSAFLHAPENMLITWSMSSQTKTYDCPLQPCLSHTSSRSMFFLWRSHMSSYLCLSFGQSRCCLGKPNDTARAKQLDLPSVPQKRRQSLLCKYSRQEMARFGGQTEQETKRCAESDNSPINPAFAEKIQKS